MVRYPSEQDIQDHLAALNRICQAWEGTIDTVLAKKKGIENYLQWFRKYGIVCHQDVKGQTWRLGPSPTEQQGVSTSIEEDRSNGRAKRGRAPQRANRSRV
jgi:hypothetical protein